MARSFRWILRVFLALCVLVIAAVIFAYYLASRSLPDYNATWTLQGPTAPIEIVRDQANVPHIFGKTDADVYYGLGFAHAQDRLWQMTMMRRTAEGRLSELFGKRTLNIDKLLRRLDLYGLAQASFEAQDAPTKAALTAYAAGVNGWLKTVNDNALGRGAPEFFLFSRDIAPWRPADSLAILKLMGLQLSAQLEEEVIRARTSLLLPPARVADILPDAPGPGIAALPDYAALVPGVLPGWNSARADDSMLNDPLSPFRARAFAGASNAFAAAPSRSASGGTLLANDPHMALTAPTVWYLARLELSSGGVIGGTIPGMPVVMAGRSADLGWAVTSSYMDDQDVHIEKLNPDNPEEYLTPDGYKPFKTRDSIIQVKDGAPVTIKLRWTDNGPVLPPEHYNLGAITPPGHVATVAWTLLTDKDTTMSAARAIETSKSVEQAVAAGKDFIAPSQNLTVVDQKNIAMKTIGAMPLRAAGNQSKGRLPTPGWLPQNRWQGRADYSANPEFIAPQGGILGNTNNKIVDRPFPFHVSYFWGDTQRINRLRKLMQSRKVHTRESFIEAQLDTVSYSARSLLPLIGKDLWFTGEAAPEGTVERRRQEALKLLADWNGEMNEHLPEPLIYAAWVRALQERLIRDEMGPLANAFTRVEPLFIERVFRDVNGASVWCDVVQSVKRETCDEISRQALDDALLWIKERYGGSLASLRWGDAHQAVQDHPVLGNVPILKWFVNIRQSTSGGDNTLMRGVTSGKEPNPFQNVHAAGYRGVYDFADPDSSVFITSTGQSGNPLSRFYDNLGELWRRGEYVPMSLDPALARAAAVGITRIEPAGATSP